MSQAAVPSNQADQPSSVPLPRGIRNNNPGNIRHSAANWQGQSQRQPDTAFITFDSPEYGIRALARILINYQVHHHLQTVEQIINRWAPPTENLTAAYVRAVARGAGVSPTARIDLTHNRALLARIVTAIISHENGSPSRLGRDQWYSLDVIQRGVNMALHRPVHRHEDRSHHHIHRNRAPHSSPLTQSPRILLP